MPAWKKFNFTLWPSPWRLLRLIGLCFLFAYMPAESAKAGENGYFAINKAKTRLGDGIYLLDAELDYQLGEEPLEALHNGVPLTLVLDIKVKRKRWYVWQETIASLEQKYRIGYMALTGQYSLLHLNTGIQENFIALYEALEKISEITDFPLLDRQLIDKSAKKSYSVHLKSYLDIEALPAPLRPVAYFSGQWRLTSGTYLCTLDP